MKAKRAAEVVAWLATEPPIEELQAAYPREWQKLSREAAMHGEAGDPQLRDFILAELRPTRNPTDRTRSRDELVHREIRRRMLLELLRRADLAAETRIDSGRIRLGLVNGWIAQRLLFERALRRKPASLLAFRLVWPLLWQRRLILPLVRRQGIYCFYSRSLIRRLAVEVGGRRTLEIAAGDGTLARFLRNDGVALRATDDYSWARHVSIDDSVEPLDAARALKRYMPVVVICSWPPPGNSFEDAVFRTESVQTYILITSATRADAGNWDAYERQTAFDVRLDRRLSRLVLPIGASQVYQFTRRDSGWSGTES